MNFKQIGLLWKKEMSKGKLREMKHALLLKICLRKLLDSFSQEYCHGPDDFAVGESLSYIFLLLFFSFQLIAKFHSEYTQTDFSAYVFLF